VYYEVNPVSHSKLLYSSQLPGPLVTGEQLYVDGFSGDSMANEQVGGPTAWFYICSIESPYWCTDVPSLHPDTALSLPSPNFLGYSAETIVELPITAPSVGWLANFGTLDLQSDVFDGQYNYYDPTNTPSVFINLVDETWIQGYGYNVTNVLEYPYFIGDPNVPWSYSAYPPYMWDPWDQGSPQVDFSIKWISAN
jgi:hypothetical protein